MFNHGNKHHHVHHGGHDKSIEERGDDRPVDNNTGGFPGGPQGYQQPPFQPNMYPNDQGFNQPPFQPNYNQFNSPGGFNSPMNYGSPANFNSPGSFNSPAGYNSPANFNNNNQFNQPNYYQPPPNNMNQPNPYPNHTPIPSYDPNQGVDTTQNTHNNPNFIQDATYNQPTNYGVDNTPQNPQPSFSDSTNSRLINYSNPAAGQNAASAFNIDPSSDTSKRSRFSPFNAVHGIVGTIGGAVQGATNTIFDFTTSNQEPPPSSHSPFDWSVSPALTRYSQHSGCDMDMYNDAEETWRDLLPAIQQAQKFIYIMGWSVWTDLIINREGGNNLNLGQILIQKADQGVTVCVMVWDDQTSVREGNTQILKGLMGTFDDLTCSIFAHTRVIAQKVSRDA
eukprot:TRINITY_DN7221_c0_g1_i1.p2 TRINITY_DN7221_c0_g1~~TRINITY_DN7221_c0_g1_i1.p2  ORF type:complete len:393 (-),score=103.90 TRINITY_DN7221_c0_g1_i1:1532-2710(-)